MSLVALRRARLLLVTLGVLVLGACGGGQQVVPDAADVPDQPAGGWPTALPVDCVQPWESVDSRGYVVPAGGARCVSALGDEGVFAPGVEREAQSPSGVSDNGEAAHFVSAVAGSGAVSWAYWRLTLSGTQPGMVSLYVNLLKRGSGGLSEYHVGLADYAAGSWEWHGPFADSHVRLSTARSMAAGSDYLSPLGNLFICLVASNGASFDVVGVGAEPVYTVDSTPPPTPDKLVAEAVAGGLELRWLSVAASDLAGYRVYHRGRWFMDAQAVGVQQVPYLVRGTRYVLCGLSSETYVRVAAVDVSGNESAPSEFILATPLQGMPPELLLTASTPSGLLNDPITLTASVADAYDWDLDGDGEYEVTGDTAGTRQADTRATGLIGARVRGAADGGKAVALGGVNLIITANARPVASATAEPQSGQAPLTVTFTGTAEDLDGKIVSYSWDFEGDGTYDYTSPVRPSPVTHRYVVGGLYQVKFRVEDDQGAWDVDTVALEVMFGLELPNEAPVAKLAADKTSSYGPFRINFDATASHDPDGSIVLYEWDFDGDGAFEDAGSAGTASYTFPVYGWYKSLVRVTDEGGKQDSAVLDITLPTEWWMFGMSPSHNRRSPYVGAQTNYVKWSYATEDEVRSSPVIGADGTIYVGSYDGNLYAFNPDGSLNWSCSTPSWVFSSPAIGADGTIYVGTHGNNLCAINPDGSLKWSYLPVGGIDSSPAIGADGTIYVVSGSDGLCAINPDGSLKWSNTTAGHSVYSSPAIDLDGTIYTGGWPYSLIALDFGGRLKWRYYTTAGLVSSPAIGADGSIYVGVPINGESAGRLCAFNRDGDLKWSYTTKGIGYSYVYSSPAIGAGGTIYVGSYNDKLYAFEPDGSVKWVYLTGGDIYSSPAIGADGTIYVGSRDDRFYAITPYGSLKWSYLTGGDVDSSPAIGADGTVYVGSNDGRLYAFGLP